MLVQSSHVQSMHEQIQTSNLKNNDVYIAMDSVLLFTVLCVSTCYNYDIIIMTLLLRYFTHQSRPRRLLPSVKLPSLRV